MKKIFFVALFTLSSCILVAQTDSSNANSVNIAPSTSSDTTGMAKIYVIRSTGHVASAVNLRIMVDDVMFCKVRNNRYAMFFVTPGTHMFNATSWDKPGSRAKSALKMPVEAGKTYYLSMRVNQKFMGIEMFLEEITYNTAAPALQKYKLDECD